MNMKEKKKKTTLEFYERTLNRILSYRSRNHVSSNSEAVSTVLDSILDLSPDTACNLANFCLEQSSKIKLELESYSGFARNDKEQKLSEYKRLADFFQKGWNIEPVNKDNNMRRIDICDGYVIFPDDWIVTSYQNPKECKYVVVVETMHGSEYQVPHFLAFCEKPIDQLTSSDTDAIYESCCKEYPDFKKILALDVPPKLENHNQLLNKEEWLKAPHPGLFCIDDYGQPDTNYPYGAMVFRTSKQSKKQ